MRLQNRRAPYAIVGWFLCNPKLIWKLGFCNSKVKMLAKVVFSWSFSKSFYNFGAVFRFWFYELSFLSSCFCRKSKFLSFLSFSGFLLFSAFSKKSFVVKILFMVTEFHSFYLLLRFRFLGLWNLLIFYFFVLVFLQKFKSFFVFSKFPFCLSRHFFGF